MMHLKSSNVGNAFQKQIAQDLTPLAPSTNAVTPSVFKNDITVNVQRVNTGHISSDGRPDTELYETIDKLNQGNFITNQRDTDLNQMSFMNNAR